MDDKDDGLWSIKSIAAFADHEILYVREKMACHPDFPKAIRTPVAGGGRSNPRWEIAEVKAYIRSHKEDLSNRRRARQ